MMKLVSHAPVDAAADQVIQLFKNVAKDFLERCLLAYLLQIQPNTADVKAPNAFYIN